MARKARIVLPSHPHHVILRGNNRRRLFSRPDDRRLFVHLTAASAERFDCKVNGFCAMTNHVHLVANPPVASALSQFVKCFAERYALLRNRAQGSSGKLFEERFVSIPILSERQLAVTLAYIELNPVRAGLVEHPSEYRWSTYALHTGRASALLPRLWTPSDWYRELGWDAAERAREYAAWVDWCATKGERPEREDIAKWAEKRVDGVVPRRPDNSPAI